MNKEEAVFEQLTLSDFEMWSSNNSEDKRILVRYYCLCCLFWVNWTGWSGEFHVVIEHSERNQTSNRPQKFHLEHFEREIDYILPRGFLLP